MIHGSAQQTRSTTPTHITMTSCASSYLLYGSELSYFTGKVRAYLR